MRFAVNFLKSLAKRFLITCAIFRQRELADPERLLSNQQGQADCNIFILSPLAIGDYIIFSTGLHRIRKHLPRARICLCVASGSQNGLIAMRSGLIDEVFELPSRLNLGGCLRVIHEVRSFQPTILILAEPIDSPVVLLTLLSTIVPLRIGFVHEEGWINSYSRLYNIILKYSSNESRRGTNIATALGFVDTVIESKAPPQISITVEELRSVDRILGTIILKRGPVVCIQPGSSQHQQWKRWPVRHFESLIRLLNLRLNATCVIIGSKGEENLHDYLVNALGNEVLSVVGKTTLLETIAIIKRSQIVICNDSSAMHLAAVTRTPAVTIYGPTDPNRTKPRVPSIVAVQKPFDCSPCFRPNYAVIAENCRYGYRCLNEVLPEDVYTQIESLLEVRSPRDLD